MKTPIAITGATGYMGSYLVKHLPSDFCGLSRSTDKSSEKNLQLFKGDLSSLDLKVFLQNCPTLIHLVNEIPSGYKTKLSNLEREQKRDTQKKLFEKFSELHPEGKIIFSSTGGEMYNESVVSPQKEEQASPSSVYAEEKKWTEEYLEKMVRGTKVSAVSLRIGNPFWFNVHKAKQRGLIPVAVACAREKKSLKIFENLKSSKDYFYMHDLVSLFEILTNRELRPGHNYVFNVGSGMSSSIQDILEILERKLGATIELQLENAGLVPKYNALDIGKIARELDWRPQYTPSQGIDALLKAL